jgi:hypothetical protein
MQCRASGGDPCPHQLAYKPVLLERAEAKYIGGGVKEDKDIQFQLNHNMDEVGYPEKYFFIFRI